MIAGQGRVRARDVADEDPGAAELLVAAHQRQQDRHRAPLRPGAQVDVAQGRQGNGRQVCDRVIRVQGVPGGLTIWFG